MKRETLKEILKEQDFALENPEPFFRLFEGMFRFFFFVRELDGQISSVSAKVTPILGFSPEDFLENWREYLSHHPDNDIFLSRSELPSNPENLTCFYKAVFQSKNLDPMWLEIYEVPALEKGKPAKIYGMALDFTERNLLEHKLRLGEKRFREMSQSSPIGIFQADTDGLITYVNPAWESITGRSITEILGKPWWEPIHPGDKEDIFKKWMEAEKEGKEVSIECRVVQKDSKVIWILLRSQFLFDDTGKATIATVENIDQQVADREKQKQLIHELLQLKEKLEIATRTDPLTGLPNRRDLNEKLAYEQARFERTSRPFSVLILDLDKFKNINDTYGHDAGDFILVRVGEMLRTTCRRMDHVCRWGGEEFFFLLPETNLRNGIKFAEKLRETLEEQSFDYKGQKIRVTGSIGLSSYNADTVDLEDCLKRADDCMYEAKNSGRNKVVAGTPSKK